MASSRGVLSFPVVGRYYSSQTHRLIGKPDEKSNLILVKMRPPRNHAESKLQMLEQQIYDFNHTFWKEHNIEFQQAKSDYINKLLSTTNLTRNELTSNHLMEFHRSFLNGKYQTHKQYLKQWTIMNFRLSWELLKYRLRHGLK